MDVWMEIKDQEVGDLVRDVRDLKRRTAKLEGLIARLVGRCSVSTMNRTFGAGPCTCPSCTIRRELQSDEGEG